MKGLLVTFEGGDGSGKATQSERLHDRLAAAGLPVRTIRFPDYDHPSSTLVRMYLEGAFGDKPEDVNAYVASTFYAVDRFASYRLYWKAFWEQGGIVIADRYTTSNMVHQMVKIADEGERATFLQWLEQLEYTQFGLPQPDAVCLLDVTPSVTERMIAARSDAEGRARDIHEQDRVYLARCHSVYDMLVARYGWNRIACDDGMQLASPDEIAERVYASLLPLLRVRGYSLPEVPTS